MVAFCLISNSLGAHSQRPRSIRLKLLSVSRMISKKLLCPGDHPLSANVIGVTPPFPLFLHTFFTSETEIEGGWCDVVVVVVEGRAS